jgi:hypothetical protein
MSESKNGKTGIRRRTLVAGTAWAVPAIAIAAPAMAFSASGPVTSAGCAGKLPGGSCSGFSHGYRFYFTAINPPIKTACIEILAVRVGASGVVGGGTNVPQFAVNVPAGCGSTNCCGAGTNSLSVAPSTTVTFSVDANIADNSANTDMQIDYKIHDANNCSDVQGPFTAITAILTTPSPAGNCNPFPVPTHYGCSNVVAPFCHTN